MITTLDGQWLLAPDPTNTGRDHQWWRNPAPDARSTKVPWIIQDAFPEYHGVAWYWLAFTAPEHPLSDGRYLLRFWAVDYAAEVWLNEVRVGEHEGAETPFTFDVTDAVVPGAENRLAVRVLNPTDEPIDGIVLGETPHRNKVMKYSAGSSHNLGGITDSVELVLAPVVRIEDVFAQGDSGTGEVSIRVTLRNAGAQAYACSVRSVVGPAAAGGVLATDTTEVVVGPGDTEVEVVLTLVEPHLWDLNDPYLYRAMITITADAPSCTDEHSVTFGLRDFRFTDGCFHLNGRPIYLRSSHTGNHAPIGLQLAHDPDLFRRDLLNVKVMGFNMIRFIAGMPTRYQLDLCDQIGLLVYDECYAAWVLGDSPHMAERFDRSVSGMIRRDRNHASVVIWGLLNETVDGPVFRHAVETLPLVRSLDESRMVLLNSGRWDGQMEIGSLSNPDSHEWELLLGGEGVGEKPTTSKGAGYTERVGDAHLYPRVPHGAKDIEFIRTMGHDTKPLFLSEYGIGSAVDLWRLARHFEQLGAESAEDAQFYRARLDDFMADWKTWRMDETFASPADYFAKCVAKMAGQRTVGLNAIRSNPKIVAQSLTGTVDQGMTGEGLFTTFRELKPGTTDALFDALAPVRLCLFAEPCHMYSGQSIRLEAVLAEEKTLPPGDYEIALQIVGPDGGRVFERTTVVTLSRDASARPFAQSFFDEEVRIDGPTGEYRFLAEIQRGAAATGGEARFHVTSATDMPAVPKAVTLCGHDDELRTWLTDHDMEVRVFAKSSGQPEVIIVSGPAGTSIAPETMRSLLGRVEIGSTAIFLASEVFGEGDDAERLLSITGGGRITECRGWLYLKDEWTARHPIFNGLPTGLMDYTYYREIIPDRLFSFGDTADWSRIEVIAAANRTSQNYESGTMLSVHPFGTGRIILNTLLIREHVGSHPVAERLLRNMILFATGQTD